MNQGQYFKNWRKSFLTIINVGVLGIAIAIVSFSSATCQDDDTKTLFRNLYWTDLTNI
jgi:hypothetical protein